MISALFDEKRRKEIRNALLHGRRIEFRRKAPQTEGKSSIMNDSPFDFSGPQVRIRDRNPWWPKFGKKYGY